MIKTFILFVLLAHLAGCSYDRTVLPSSNTILISSPVTSENVFKSARTSKVSVVRILCKQTNMTGTGFLHKSGGVLTAAHVVSDCKPDSLEITNASGSRSAVRSTVINRLHDLAIVIPVGKIGAEAFELDLGTPSIGSQVAAWGFPAGYFGSAPLLTVGYLSGSEIVTATSENKAPASWRVVVNAAFNGGNSGGPVLGMENGKVIGVVSSKLAPIPDHVQKLLTSLSVNRYGMNFEWKNPDGTTVPLSESQVVSEVLKYLRSQTQLVVGYSVPVEIIRTFLIENNIIP